MNVLPIEKRTQIINLLVEGNSMRATSEYQDKAMRNLTCKRIQCDEIWAFCYCKEKNVAPEQVRYPWFWRCLDLDCD